MSYHVVRKATEDAPETVVAYFRTEQAARSACKRLNQHAVRLHVPIKYVLADELYGITIYVADDDGDESEYSVSLVERKSR